MFFDLDLREILHVTESAVNSLNSAGERRLNRPPHMQVGNRGGETKMHIDFGGTSFWMALLRGSKTFVMVPPESYFALNTSRCFKYVDLPGNSLSLSQSMFIIEGSRWIMRATYFQAKCVREWGLTFSILLCPSRKWMAGLQCCSLGTLFLGLAACTIKR